MALKATIFKAEIHISDMDRGYYGQHSLTIARHPSETDQRMMVRLLAFAFHAHESLQFTRGLSTDDEPELWQKSLTDDIDLWIDVGLPDEKRLRKACGRARQVMVYAYGARTVAPWWELMADKLSRFDNLTVYSVPASISDGLAKMAQRTMNVQCVTQDGQMWFSDGEGNLDVVLDKLFPPV